MATARPKQARKRSGSASRTRPRTASATYRAKPKDDARPAPRDPSSRHRRELGAIACLAIAVFLAFVLYLGWDGGSLGRWLGEAARWSVGVLAFALPLLLGFLAYLLVVREENRPRRGMTWGVALIVAGVALAAAADAFGIFAGERVHALFRDEYMSAHGGLLGEVQWAVLSPFIGRVGVDVLVVALVLAGILLVTGSSLRQWADHSKKGVAKAGRAARSQAEAFGARRKEATDTRVLELDESPTIDASDQMRTSIRPAVTPELDFSRPEPAGTHLIDGAVRRAGDLRRAHTAAGLSRPRARARGRGRRRRAALARRRCRRQGGRRRRRCGRRRSGARLRRGGEAPVEPARRGDPAAARTRTPASTPEAIARTAERLVATLGQLQHPRAGHRHRLRAPA